MNGFEVFHCIPPVLVSYEDDEETLVCFCFPSNSRKTNWNSYENICVVLQYRRTNASLKNFCSYFWEFHLNVCMFFLLRRRRRRLNWISLALGSFRGVWIVWLWNDKLTLRELTLMLYFKCTRAAQHELLKKYTYFSNFPKYSLSWVQQIITCGVSSSRLNSFSFLRSSIYFYCPIVVAVRYCVR